MAKKKKNRRRAMPAALRAYWAKKRAGLAKTVRTTARRIKRRARRTVAAAPVAIRRRFTTMAKKRRTGSRRRRAFGSSSSRGAIAGVSLKALGGTVAGMLAANQLAPRIAAMTGSAAAAGQRPFLQGQAGQAVLKIGIGLVGAYALKRSDNVLAASFAAGAIAEPAVAAIRAMLAKQNAPAGVAGLYGYLPEGVAGYLPEEGVSGLGEVMQDDIESTMETAF
jgi:hypothetical protein